MIRQRLFILAISKKLVLQDDHLKERIPIAVLLARHWYPTLFTFPYDEARSQRHWWLWHLYGNWDSSKVTSTCALPASSKFLCYFMVISLRHSSFTVTLANMLWSGNLCLYRSKAQDYLRVEFMSSWTRLCYICTISECWKTFVSYHLQKSCTCSKIERRRKVQYIYFVIPSRLVWSFYLDMLLLSHQSMNKSLKLLHFGNASFGYGIQPHGIWAELKQGKERAAKVQ